MSIDLNGVIYGIREVVKEFLSQKKGAILNTVSVGGANGDRDGVAYRLLNMLLLV